MTDEQVKNAFPKNRGKALENLGLFVERVDKLLASSFTKHIINNGLSLKIKGDFGLKELAVIVSGADQEHVEAFLLTLRMFIQKGDAICIENISGLISSLDVNEKAKENFLKQHSYLNKYLDERGMIKFNEDWPTHREILRTVLYGYLGHLKTEERAYQRYKAWASNPFTAGPLAFAFNDVLVVYLRSLQIMANNCRVILEELASKDH